jgi:hypothetical protein
MHPRLVHNHHVVLERHRPKDKSLRIRTSNNSRPKALMHRNNNNNSLCMANPCRHRNSSNQPLRLPELVHRHKGHQGLSLLLDRHPKAHQ